MSAGTAAVRAALALAGASRPSLRGAAYRPLPVSEGGANRVYRVRAAGGLFYLKVGNDAHRERWGLQALDGRHAPRLVLATSGLELALDDPRDILITAAVPGTPAKRLGEGELAALADTLHGIHRVRPKRGPALAGGTTPLEVLAAVRGALRTVAAARLVGAGGLAALQKRVRDAAKQVAAGLWELDSLPRALCHGDLRLPNILFHEGAAALIDFEYAGLADPMIDVARLVALGELTSHQELCLLDAYAEAGGARDVPRYFAYRPLASLAAGLGAAASLAQARSGRLALLDGRWAARRAPHVRRLLSTLVGDDVRLAEAA